ncbi:hypothetical protein STRDD11_01971 [Streptococcus sp. DD11]|nr:hypothetical protein STRDD11_01971 [Streptococcus sp. DD11]
MTKKTLYSWKNAANCGWLSDLLMSIIEDETAKPVLKPSSKKRISPANPFFPTIEQQAAS